MLLALKLAFPADLKKQPATTAGIWGMDSPIFHPTLLAAAHRHPSGLEPKMDEC